MVGAEVQRRLLVFVDGVEVGSVLDEKLSRDGVVAQRGFVQRRVVAVAHRVDVRAAGEGALHVLARAVARGGVEHGVFLGTTPADDPADENHEQAQDA